MTSRAERVSASTDRREAFAALADAHLEAAYRLAGVILGDPFEAEDATHDAVITAWRGYGKLRDPDRFEAWFQRILVNTCRDRLRRRGRRQAATEIDLTRVPTGGSDPFARVDDRLALDAAFETLSPDHRVVIALRFYADLTVEQIAERVDAPAGTVKSRLHAATQRLQAALGADAEEQA